MVLALLCTLLAAGDGGVAAPGARPAPAGTNLFAVGKSRFPPVGPDQYHLKPAKDGGYLYEDERFSARVASDGQVSFADKRYKSSALQWLPIWPENHPQGTKTLEGALRSLLSKHRQRPQESTPPPLPPPPQVNPPLSMRDPGALPLGYPQMMIPVVQKKFRMDLYDEYLRFLGEDPYRYEKSRFLTATFDHRMRMAVDARAEATRKSLARLPESLDAIWADPAYSTRERKRIVCVLWAELDTKQAAGAKAAGVIEAFVRRKLLPENPDRYTDEEMAACSANSDGRKFSPR